MTPQPEPGFSREEMHARLDATRAFMRERDLAAMLFYGAGRAAEIEYLTEWPGTREAHLVVSLHAEPRLFVQLFNHAPNALRVSVVAQRLGRAGLGADHRLLSS